MKKEKYKKIPISEFISDKKLVKIKKIIDTSESVDVAYDRIELLLNDDFIVNGLGTNRLVLLHKKNKFKDLIFKVAGDSHGIEANYREFYNGDLDKSLTFSYSISDDGLFIVQERVKVFDSKMMNEKKKEVRKMLHNLSNKILLVDCKLSNFKNFGIRKNGDIVLLDHGDTVPLPNSQKSNIVNLDEESNVSLKCKKFKDASEKISKLKPCGGKLEYSKDYDYLICKKCGAVMSVNDAYKEFYGDKNAKINIHNDFITSLNFDPDKWSKTIKEYAKDTMSSVNKKNNKKEGEIKMKEKVIEDKKCTQLKGYWVPETVLNNPAYSMLINSVKLNKIKPKDFIKSIGLNPSTYAVRIEDHTPNKDRHEWKEQLPIAVNEVLKIMKEHNGENKFDITYKEIEERCGFVVDTIEKEKEIYKRVIGSNSIAAFIYKKDKFIVIINEETPNYYEDDEIEDEINVNDDHTIHPDPNMFLENIDKLLGIMPKELNDTQSIENSSNAIEIDNNEEDEEYKFDGDDEYNENKEVENNIYLNDNDTWNKDFILSNYDLSILKNKINDILQSKELKSNERYCYKTIDIDSIVEMFNEYNELYDEMFTILINKYYEENENYLIRDFISLMDFDDISYIDMNSFDNCIEFIYIYKTNEIINSEEQSNEDNSEEDFEMNDMQKRISKLEQSIQDIFLIVERLSDRIDNSNNENEEESDESDDDDSDYSIVGYPTRDNNILTIDIDQLPSDCSIVLNKDGILFRLNPNILNVENAEDGLYDIIRASLKRFGGNN